MRLVLLTGAFCLARTRALNWPNAVSDASRVTASQLIAASTLKSAEITGLTCTAISEYAPDTGAPLVCSNVFVDSNDIAAPGDDSYVWAADNEGASDKLGGCVGIWIEVTLPDEYTVDIVTIRQRYAALDQGDEMDVALKSTSGAVLSTQHITFTDVGTSNPLEEAFSLTPTAGVKSIRFTFTKADGASCGSNGGYLGAKRIKVYGTVLSNDEVVLPNPWDVVVNTPSDRDVGTVTEHAFAPAYELEVVPDSLETAAEQSGGAPTIAIRRILVAETRNSTQPPPSYRMGGVGGQTVRHLNGMENPAGATTVWGWQRNRYFALQAWMATKGDSDLMAVHASGEVLFAGCDESTILSKYNQIIAANGGTQTIVIAAEVSPFHADLGYYYDISTAGLDSTRTGALSYLSAAADWATTYAACTSGVCNSPPKYQFANPGFIMGPVADIAEMFADMPKWADTENRLINQYYLSNTDKVALDFAGTLVMSLHNMKLDANIPVEVELVAGIKRIKNKVTQELVTPLLSSLSADRQDCRFLDDYPPIIIELRGLNLTLHPQDYMRQMPLPSDIEIGSGSSAASSDDGDADADARNATAQDKNQAESWSCKSRVVGVTMPPQIGDALFILGQPVFHRYYVAFDYEGPRLGFGLAAARSVEPSDEEWMAVEGRSPSG
ncbi:unnamed protein product [Prorocentrum cordatum]|uniref:Peptidase A1 domain-containing protein n=1 Tax=Prorocentrum cordatum TaxID=2364126 RepID=A0ABN9TB02_9DINO|nr:unnamed protein product [Polarella glacialis]